MKAILHAGIPKTGSSSIQESLVQNRAKLEELGFYVPHAFSVPGRARHLKIAGLYTTKSPNLRRRRRMKIGENANVDSIRKSELETLSKEIEAHSDKVFIFSDEQIALIPKDMQFLLRSEFGKLFSEVKLMLYLRRQDLHSISMYHESLKLGNTVSGPFQSRHYYQYDKFLKGLADVFGPEHVKPRIFERPHLVGNDVVSDFYSAIGLKDTSSLTATVSRNISPSTDVIQSLRDANRLLDFLPDSAETDARKKALRLLMMEAFPGPSPTYPPEDARAFYTQFETSNELVQETWFPHKDTLFSENFPVAARMPEHSESDIQRVLSMLVDIAVEELGRHRPASETPEKRPGKESGMRKSRRYSGALAQLDYQIHKLLSVLPFASSDFRYRFGRAAEKRRRELSSPTGKT